MIVPDTGARYAALDANETLHGRAVAALTAATPPRVISPFVLAELDYLVGSRVGHKAQMALLDEVGRGAYSSIRFRQRTSATPGGSWSATPTCESGWQTRRW